MHRLLPASRALQQSKKREYWYKCKDAFLLSFFPGTGRQPTVERACAKRHRLFASDAFGRALVHESAGSAGRGVRHAGEAGRPADRTSGTGHGSGYIDIGDRVEAPPPARIGGGRLPRDRADEKAAIRCAARVATHLAHPYPDNRGAEIMKVVEQPEGRTVHTAGKEPMPKLDAVKAATPAAKVAAPRTAAASTQWASTCSTTRACWGQTTSSTIDARPGRGSPRPEARTQARPTHPEAAGRRVRCRHAVVGQRRRSARH